MADDWWDRLRSGWWIEDRIQPTEARRKYYEAKREIVERIQPWFIAEIGVRAGYSAWAMLDAAPDGCRYLGIDADNGTHGGDPGALDHARALLAPFDTEIWVEDSQEIDQLPEAIDLLHIDGDHSFEGCLSDLRLAEWSGVRWVLLDDYDYLAGVREAANAFCFDRVAELWRIDDGHRGMALLNLRDIK